MGDEADATDLISFLSRSNYRIQMLTTLLASGPVTSREFRERLQASRSTVTRTLSALEDRGLITSVDGGYRLTPTGRIIADAVGDLVETVQTTDDLSTFLEWFPYSEYEVALDDLRGATVTTSTETNPYAPARQHAATIDEVDDVRMLLPSIDLQLVEGVHDRVANGDLSVELLVAPAMEATITSDEFATEFREQMAAGDKTVFVTDDQPPFYLGLADDDLVQIGVEDDEGFPRALLESTDDSLREWGEDVYAQYRANAREMTSEEF